VVVLLKKKTVVVYGAGGAVGGAVARAFAREGASVFLAGRTRSTLDAVAGDIVASGGVATVATVDAGDERAVQAHLDAVFRETDGIDVTFNAIGMDDVQGTLLVEMSVEDFLRPVTAAARTQFVTAKCAARRMLEKRSGVLMTITAGPAHEATSHIGGFGAACEAIEGLWRTLAAELGPHGIRVVCLRSAGSPDAPAVEEVFRLHAAASGVPLETYLARAGSATLMGRLPTLSEVANAATLMASSHASALTGTFVNVTCGSRVD
jgi:3-oxoacyl-[acyl-carrier protein] reductase